MYVFYAADSIKDIKNSTSPIVNLGKISVFFSFPFSSLSSCSQAKKKEKY